MSSELRVLKWAVTIDDSDRWTAIHRAQAEDSSDYAEWATDQLRHVMQQAGNAYVDANPDLFRCGLT